MTSIYYTSDTHFGHRRVSEIRGFASTAEHDQAIIDNWKKVVKPRDQVWILGDLCIGRLDDTFRILEELPGELHLIAGNHDPVHPMHKSAHRYQPRYLNVFSSVQPFAKHSFDGRNLLLSHFPYSRDREEARYMQWRLRDEGEWLLHGHTHGQEKQVGKEIHVGLDAWGMSPVSRDTIVEMITRSEGGPSGQ